MRMLSPLSTDWSWPRRSLSSSTMRDVFDDFDSIAKALAKNTYTNPVSFQPSCDINESKDHYFLSFDLPGVKKEDIKIELHSNHLNISGERQCEVKEDDDETILRQERFYGKFERTFTLPTSVNVDKIEAHYENGVLNIALPKSEKAKGRSIQIQTGHGSFFSKLLSSKEEARKEIKDVKV
ncbi:MAG: Hsp20/alpha crystallin family protein [Bacillota bacterium]